MVKVKWQAVANVLGYEIILESPHDSTRIFEPRYQRTDISIKQLRPNTMYTVKVRSKSIAGYSNQTSVDFKTKNSCRFLKILLSKDKRCIQKSLEEIKTFLQILLFNSFHA